MPRRKIEHAPWSAEREFRWECPACHKVISCRSDQQCASQILVHLASHDILIPLLAKCINVIEQRIREMQQSEIKL